MKKPNTTRQERKKIRLEKTKQRKDQLNKWAHGDAKSSVSEYKT